VADSKVAFFNNGCALTLAGGWPAEYCDVDDNANIEIMNRFEKFLGLKGEAKVKFAGGEFHVLVPGDFVRCAVTGDPIPLTELRYWNVSLQEAYATPEAALKRHLETLAEESKN